MQVCNPVNEIDPGRVPLYPTEQKARGKALSVLLIRWRPNEGPTTPQPSDSIDVVVAPARAKASFCTDNIVGVK